MEQKNKKFFRVGLIILLGTLTFILVLMIVYKNKKNISPAVNQKVEENDKGVNESVEISEEKKVEVDAIRNITGKIGTINVDAIKVVTKDGEKITLSISQEGANFFSQTKRGDGIIITKEIGLFDIPTNQEVSIQYNSLTNEVMLVEVK